MAKPVMSGFYDELGGYEIVKIALSWTAAWTFYDELGGYEIELDSARGIRCFLWRLQ